MARVSMTNVPLPRLLPKELRATAFWSGGYETSQERLHKHPKKLYGDQSPYL